MEGFVEEHGLENEYVCREAKVFAANLISYVLNEHQIKWRYQQYSTGLRRSRDAAENFRTTQNDCNHCSNRASQIPGRTRTLRDMCIGTLNAPGKDRASIQQCRCSLNRNHAGSTIQCSMGAKSRECGKSLQQQSDPFFSTRDNCACDTTRSISNLPATENCRTTQNDCNHSGEGASPVPHSTRTPSDACVGTSGKENASMLQCRYSRNHCGSIIQCSIGLKSPERGESLQQQSDQSSLIRDKYMCETTRPICNPPASETTQNDCNHSAQQICPAFLDTSDELGNKCTASKNFSKNQTISRNECQSCSTCATSRDHGNSLQRPSPNTPFRFSAVRLPNAAIPLYPFSRGIGVAVMHQLIAAKARLQVLLRFVVSGDGVDLRSVLFVADNMFFRPSLCLPQVMVFCTYFSYISLFCARRGLMAILNDFVLIIACNLGGTVRDTFLSAGGWTALSILADRRNRRCKIACAA